MHDVLRSSVMITTSQIYFTPCSLQNRHHRSDTAGLDKRAREPCRKAQWINQPVAGDVKPGNGDLTGDDWMSCRSPISKHQNEFRVGKKFFQITEKTTFLRCRNNRDSFANSKQNIVCQNKNS